MDWNSWVTWTAQGLFWAVLAIFFYYMVVRIHSAERMQREIDKYAVERAIDKIKWGNN